VPVSFCPASDLCDAGQLGDRTRASIP
jgi:hypothetical protein